MLNRIISKTMSIVFLVSLLTATAQAAPAKPQDIIESATSALIKGLQTERDANTLTPESIQNLAQKLLVPHLNLTKISRLVLGKHWRRATSEQKEAFQDLFIVMLMQTYTTALAENIEVALTRKVNYLPMTRDSSVEDDVTVRTEINSTTGKPVPVNYRLHLKKGNWKIYDVTVAGISLVVTYRNNFSSEIRRGGLDKLISRLASHNDKRTQAALTNFKN
ncbi:MAG: ABC transporter substrate-binding protein [Gammaproteobacteria bacterium]|nr:ABC transporter substrate-binding protein [Gammaproteobacteria bacterium]